MKQFAPLLFISTVLFVLFAAFASATAAAQGGESPASMPSSYVLKAGMLYPGDAQPIANATMVVRDGRIEWIRVGAVEIPHDLPVIDRSDSTIVPGFIASETALSDAFEERFGFTSFGTIVTFRNVDPLRKSIDGFSFIDRREPILSGGVTTVYLSPGQRRLVNGRGSIVKLAGASQSARTLRETADLSLSIGDAAKNPPGRFEAPLPPSAENPVVPAEPQMPRSRAAAVFTMREVFDSALLHAKLINDAKTKNLRPAYDPEKAELAELLKLKQPVRIRTSADIDVNSALSLLKDYGLSGVLVGANEADRHADKLKDAGVAAIIEIPIVSGSLPDADSRADLSVTSAKTAAALVKSGVRVAITPANDAQLADASLILANAVRAGMTRVEAVRAMTSDAARILGVANSVGTLTSGHDADFLVLNGEPGEATTTIRETWINGARVFDRFEADRARREFKKRETAGQSIVVKAGLVIPVVGDPIPNGSVAIHEGKIIAIGRDVAVPRGARVIDAGADSVITPGLIDSRSFLGLEGDTTPAQGSVQLSLLANPQGPDSRLVVSGGVTTALVQGVVPSMPGTPIAAIKTGGPSENAIIREVCGVAIPTQGSNAEGYRALLRRGKDYTDRWDKYFVESDKAKEDAKKAAAEGKKADEKPDTTKEEAKPKDATPEPEASDPVTGTWEGEIWGGPLPRREPFTLKLKLKGDVVSGSFSSRSPLAGGEDIPFEGGKFKDSTITISITRPEIPFPINIEAKIDRPDHMTGKVDARVITLEMEASRTEKAAPSINIKGKTKKKGPEMPAVDETLEPYRRLLKNDAALVVQTNAKNDIEAAMAAASDEFKLSLVILGGADAKEIAPAMAAKRVGILTGPNLLPSKSDSGLPLITELAMSGVMVAIGSESGTGAHRMPEFGYFATSRGAGADMILKSLTIDPARLFRIDSRVGSLEPGKDGDLIIWSGMPFRASSQVKTVVIGGEVVSGSLKN
ncbi:MAG: amidohydrolase family protein [Planctomycetota bacterium]